MLLSLVICFWQLQLVPTHPSEESRLRVNVRTASFEQLRSEEVRLRKLDFENRLNHLIDAIKVFSEAYNQSTGAVWPAKKAEALRKAIHNLEKSKELSWNEQ